MGSGGAQWYRRKNPRADPLLCAWGVLLSVPFAFFGIVVAHKSAPLSWFSIFLAITFLCVNWTLVADILLYVVTPNRRSFAQAIQILAAHLLGDATSPFIVGAVRFPCLFNCVSCLSSTFQNSYPMRLKAVIQRSQNIRVYSTHCTQRASC